MPIVSYAQNFEDVLLWRALGHVDRGFYVDIGAQDPVFDSVSKAFYDRGWRGVNVDASTHYAEILRQARPDEIVVQAAVSDQPGMLKFYEVHATGLSTASEGIAKNLRDAGWNVVETLVPAVILDQLFAKLDTDEIHWLKIDVEGLEQAALEGWRTSSYRPWVIVVEATSPATQITTHKEWEHLILAKDYRFVHFDGLNRYYLSAAHSELEDFFGYGPSLWDEFQLPESSRQVSSLVERQNEVLSRADAEVARQAETIAQAQTSIALLQTELATSRGLGDRLQAELIASCEHGNRLQAELTASCERGDALDIDAKRARAEAAAALRREEAAEGRMASLEMDLIRREADDRALRARNLVGRLFFRLDGRPVKPLRRLLFHTSGAPRHFLRTLVLHKNGTPRNAFAHWMGSGEYLGLPNAVKRPGHQVTKRDDAATASRSG